jgi:hypothetical protein
MGHSGYIWTMRNADDDDGATAHVLLIGATWIALVVARDGTEVVREQLESRADAMSALKACRCEFEADGWSTVWG